MTSESSALDTIVPDSTVSGMGHAIEPAWTVESIERRPYGTDFVATLDVGTPDGSRTAYAETRDEWSFDAATRERMREYRLTCRVDAMACLPLWYQDATTAEKAKREADHREFLARYL